MALLIHGYHLGVEDAAIYLPAIKKNLQPALYPFNSEFFLVQTQPMLFDELVAWSIRLTHLPFDLAIFAWHVLIVFGFLWAALRLARLCFRQTEAQWSAVAMIAALLTMPVSGTKLLLLDQYLHPRSLAAVMIFSAAHELLETRWWRAALWAVLSLPVHPQMAFFGAVWLVFLAWKPSKFRDYSPLMFPFARFFEPTNETWREAMRIRTHYFLLKWKWYMWLGAILPPPILYGFSMLAKRDGNRLLAHVARRTALFALPFLLAGLMISVPLFARLAPTQPLRSLHIVYFVMLLLAGGFLGQYLLRRQLWRWLALYLPICIGLFLAQRALFAGSDHIEWPGAKPRNSWVQAFLWARDNTPTDAIFALSPHVMKEPGEDFHGFRALAERSMLADYIKDAGMGVFSTNTAQVWHEQVHAMDGWENFTNADFAELRRRYNVTWAIVARAHPAALDCPYQNRVARVCRL